MFIICGYDADLNQIYTNFPKDSESFLKYVINFSKSQSSSLYNLMVEKGLNYVSIESLGNILAIISIDDLIVEFNLYALRQDKAVIDLFQKIYPDTNVELYSDLKTNLPEAVKEMFSTSYKKEVQYHKLNLESLRISGCDYSYTHSTNLLKNEAYNLFYYISNYAQDSVTILGAPPYGSRYVRADVRPISEIENYTFSLSNNTDDQKYVTDLCFFVPYTQERLNILNKGMNIVSN